MKFDYYGLRLHYYEMISYRCGLRAYCRAVNLNCYGRRLNYYDVRLNYYRVKLDFYKVFPNCYKVFLYYCGVKSHISEEISCSFFGIEYNSGRFEQWEGRNLSGAGVNRSPAEAFRSIRGSGAKHSGLKTSTPRTYL